MRKTNPITRIKRGKGVLVKFYSSNRVSLLYFESLSRVTVSLRKHTYSSHGSLTRLISRKNIDIGSDFKKIKRCFDHDDVDFKSFRRTKILGKCNDVCIFLPYFKLWSKSDAHSSLWTNMIMQRLSKGSISFSETAPRKNFGLHWSFSSVFIWKKIAWINTYIRTNCLRCLDWSSNLFSSSH